MKICKNLWKSRTWMRIYMNLWNAMKVLTGQGTILESSRCLWEQQVLPTTRTFGVHAPRSPESIIFWFSQSIYKKRPKSEIHKSPWQFMEYDDSQQRPRSQSGIEQTILHGAAGRPSWCWTIMTPDPRQTLGIRSDHRIIECWRGRRQRR